VDVLSLDTLHWCESQADNVSALRKATFELKLGHRGWSANSILKQLQVHSSMCGGQAHVMCLIPCV